MFLLVIHLALFAVAMPQAGVSPTCELSRVQAESSFRQRNDLKTRQQAEADLQRALEACATEPVHPRLERRLRIVQDEIATTHLQIALWLPHADGVGLLKGALYHLRIINETYSNYSHTDRVLFLLGDYSDRNGDAQDATKYFQRLIATFPLSSYAMPARERLAKLSAGGET